MNVSSFPRVRFQRAINVRTVEKLPLWFHILKSIPRNWTWCAAFSKTLGGTFITMALLQCSQQRRAFNLLAFGMPFQQGGKRKRSKRLERNQWSPEMSGRAVCLKAFAILNWLLKALRKFGEPKTLLAAGTKHHQTKTKMIHERIRYFKSKFRQLKRRSWSTRR